MTTNSGDGNETSVQVALRVRPQNAKEQIDMCQICTFCTPGQPQIVLGKDKAFTYDFVFDTDSQQDQIYAQCVESLVAGCFEGYNATVLAYGQTGSGKTYTMGTGFDMAVLPEQQGVIPRAVRQLFSTIEQLRAAAIARDDPPPQFEITAQFLELYNEDLIDLFDCNRDALKKLRIHEDPHGGIYIAGVTLQRVESEEETLSCLKQGALSRTVGSTNMNAQSSRSHAIFTLEIKQQRPIKTQVENGGGREGESEVQYEISDWESLSAKFHFVDLAGSERLKRTGATGERAKEGISINCGLLALGNVISALGDKTKKGSHVPYRDSKLTRLLQDSLGGNSRTLMVACVSPTDRDFMETLNTLKYANRARNIKNKVSVNQDKTSQQLAQLRSRIQELESELQEFHSGRKVVSEDGSVVMNDLASEVTMLRAENDKLRLRVKSLQQVIESQAERMAGMAADKELAALGRHDESTGQVVGQTSEETSHLPTVIKGYMRQIEELKSQLVLSESLGQHNPSSPYRRPPSLVLHGRQPSLLTRQASTNVLPFNQETTELLETARSDIVRLKQRKDRKDSVSDSRKAHHRPRSRDASFTTSSMSLDVVTEGEVSEARGGGGGDEEDTLFGSDEDTNSTNEYSSEEELTVQGSDSSDESEEEEDEEGMDDTASLASSVADLSSEINLKEQLVDQLEKAQRNLHVMRQQYEDKMTLLQTQIRNLESERDKVLKDIASKRSQAGGGVSSKDVKARYEKQLSELRTELKTLKLAKKEHSKAMKKNAQNENELRRLKADLLEMKKARVKMLNQMRAEASRKKQEEARQMRQISQLKKESRKKEHKIQSLEAEAQRKAIILKRRADELALLRRQTRMRHSASNSSLSSTSSSSSHPHPTHNSAQSSGVVGVALQEAESEATSAVFRDRPSVKSLAHRFERNSSRRKSSVFSSSSARKKWRDFEKKITDAIMNRLTISTLSQDMDRWIEKRDQLSCRADELRYHRTQLLRESSPDPEELQSIEEDLDSLLANVEYIQSNIVELQNELIAVDDSKSDSDTIEAHAIISHCAPRDAKYLLEHLMTMTLALGVKAEQKASLARSLEARLKTSEDNAELMKSYSSPQVSHPLMMGSRTVTKSRLATGGGRSAAVPVILDFGSDNSSQDSEDPRNLERPSCQPQMAPHNMICTTSSKMRRRTFLPSEIGINSKKMTRPSSAAGQSLPEEETEQVDGGEGAGVVPQRPRSGETRRRLLKKSSKMSVSVQDLTADSLSSASSSSSSSSSAQAATPSSPNASAARQLGTGKSDVWSRLTRSGSTNLLSDNRGQLQAEKSKVASRYLTCTHTASGHTAGVLCVFATDNLLFSGSQDRTVKIWDLNSGQEVLTLDKHFSYVRCVRYCSRNRLIFTASQSLIKIWDHRNFRGKCIKTFGPPHSSGHPGGDTVVQDLLLSSSTNTLFSASGNVVNIWDFRKFANQGRLVGHNGAVCALATNQELVMTGSRDRLIKLYEIDAVLSQSEASPTHSQSTPSHYPSVTLYPPHYDAVSSFAIHRNHLFSACGCSFKQWDTDEKQLKQTVDGAHSQGTTITSLGVLPSPLSPLLVSGCKGGLLKLWNPETCANIGEVSAHKNAINSITTSDTCIFTASSDKTIRIWRSSPPVDL